MNSLFKYWKKHIDNQKLYRVFSQEYSDSIKKQGIDPNNNPYKSSNRKIKKLFRILAWLERTHNFNHTQDWGRKELVTTDHIIKVTLEDMEKKYIDFTPYPKEVKYYQKLMRGNGGALVSTVQKITEDIIKRKPKLPFLVRWKFITNLHDWTLAKGDHKIKVLFVKGSAKCFETAIFQNKLGTTSNIKSPFGSFKHFQRIVKEAGLKTYKPFFEKNKWYNLRVQHKIPPADIQVL
ncbi:hypothetical protein HN587_06985 [Candidatus Woesearchaeota archaeon]|mgnify:CR=1 FL=1|jgi:hypothetical protein|nr:hypothetical protein [Candidatus Woesearchaeota archaeon]